MNQEVNQFDQLFLNPDNKGDLYKVWKTVGPYQKKVIDWALFEVAQRKLLAMGSAATQMNCELWIDEFSSKSPEAELAVLERLIEPQGRARSVKELYMNDKLEDSFIKEVTNGFMKSSLLEQLTERIANSQTEYTETSQSTKKKTTAKDKAEKD